MATMIWKDPFSYGEICLNVPAEEINIEDFGPPDQTFLGFYIDFFEDTVFASNKDYSLVRAIDPLDNDLPVFQDDQKNSEFVLLKLILRINSVGIFSLYQI